MHFLLLLATLFWQQPLVPTSTSVSYNSASPFNGTTTAVVKSSAGNLYGWSLYNPNSSLCVMQVWNTTSPVAGTTLELLNVAVPAFGGSNISLPYPVHFSTAITIGNTSAAHGNTACSLNMIMQILYL